MTGWRTRLAVGAVLAVLLGAVYTLGLHLYGRRVLRNPSDAAMIAHFRSHRVELEAAARRALPGPDSCVHIPYAAWFPRTRLDDVKGFAYSSRAVPVVADLDRVRVLPPGHVEVQTWHRALEGHWYLYREVGGMRSR